MQRRYATSQVVVVHMTETTYLYHCLEFVLARMHADGLGQVAVASVITGHKLT